MRDTFLGTSVTFDCKLPQDRLCRPRLTGFLEAGALSPPSDRHSLRVLAPLPLSSPQSHYPGLETEAGVRVAAGESRCVHATFRRPTVCGRDHMWL